MRLGLGVSAVADPKQLERLAAEAEALGYESIWSNDTPSGDGLKMLASWAGESSRIKLGVGVLALDRHDPASIAARVRELELPQDRLVLGVGAGWTDRPIGVVREGIAALRKELPETRLAVAAMGPQMCSLAGEVGDAALLNWMTPARARWARELVLEAAGGRLLTVYGYVRVALGTGAQDRLAQEATAYAQMPHYARHFAAMGGEPAEVGVAAVDPAGLPSGLQAYDALDVPVVRALTESPPSLERVLEIARGAVDA